MQRDQSWTGRWVANKIDGHEEVESTDLLSSQLLRVDRRELSPIVICTTAVECVSASTLEALISGPPPASFAVNIPKESYITGSAITLGAQNGFAVGGFGDLLRALSVPNVSDYENPEHIFIDRGLRQHKEISSYDRLDDRRYKIHRRGRASKTAVFLNNYELTADHVRVAYDRYDPFDILVATNPNGDPTASAEKTAKSLSIRLLKWRSFYGAMGNA